MPDMSSAGDGGYAGNALGVVQDQAEALEALSAAVSSNSIGQLRAVIQVAQVLGVEGAPLLEANARLTALEDSAARRDAAEEVLLKAAEATTWGSGETQALATALAQASEAGVDDEVLLEARALLNSRQALLGKDPVTVVDEALSEQLQMEAQNALVEASAGDDPKALEAAIDQARAADICEETLREALEALEVMKEIGRAKDEAEEALANAVAGDNFALLQATIELAEETGVSEGSLEAARGRLCTLHKSVKSSSQFQVAAPLA